MTTQLQEEQDGLVGQKQEFRIELKNLSYFIQEKRENKRCKKHILQNINGEFCSGHLTAILGPSGAGKSTLLNILSGFRINNITGSILINGQERNIQEMKKISRYITQEFAMLPLLTTKETLMMAANLKINRTELWRRNSMVSEILDLLNLTKVAHSSVGKLSGGEKKRLSVGVELLTNPPIMLFDEPTSGLDSSSSYQVITHLKSLAKNGRIMVCAIHQPSSRLFGMFDDVLVLSEGQCFYSGPIRKMTTHFEIAGFQCPLYYNRADFAIEVVSGERGNHLRCLENNQEVDYSTKEDNPDSISENTSMLPEAEASTSIKEIIIPMSVDKHDDIEMKYPVNVHIQFIILLKRCLLCTVRDLHMAQLRIAAHIVVGFLLGAIYYNMGNDAAKTSSNAACIFFFIMFLFFSNSMPTVHTFPVEASVFYREYMNSWYSLASYYFAKIFAEVPLQILCPTLFLCSGYFLTSQPYDGLRLVQFWFICILITVLGQTMGLAIGAAFDAQLGIFLVPASGIPMILFSGFFLKVQDISPYLHWLSYISYFRYSFEGAMQCVYGFNRPDLECSVPYCYYKSPSKILEEFGMESSSFGIDILGLVVWIIGLQIAFYIALRLRLKYYRQ